MTCKERLTIKYDGNSVPKACCTINRYGEADDCSSCDEICEEVVKNYNGKDTACNDCPIQKCFNRLAELENKLEDCTLTELPCKVGDTVYVIKDNMIHVKEIVYYNKILSRVAEQNEEYWHCVTHPFISVNRITFYPEDIGQTVFLTKEDAEMKLKEMREK